MLQVILGSIILSIIHAGIPNHWLPLVAIARAERWSRARALAVTAIAGIAHTASTVLVGVFVGFVGFQLAAAHAAMTRLAGSTVMVLIGLAYLIAARHGECHHHHGEGVVAGPRRSFALLILALAAAMFFSPCLEIETYFFTAGRLGWPGIIAVSFSYCCITVLGMMALVGLALRGVERFQSHWLEHHEKHLTGIVLVLFGILNWFIA